MLPKLDRQEDYTDYIIYNNPKKCEFKELCEMIALGQIK